MSNRTMTGTDGSIRYVTADGDMVDSIAHAYYGKHEKNTEAIYIANPWLADMGIVLPAGVVITLPPAPVQETPKPFRQLWN